VCSLWVFYFLLQKKVQEFTDMYVALLSLYSFNDSKKPPTQLCFV